MNKPLVSIQILNWNNGIDTLRAIKSAKAQTYPNTEILVVDNGSEDDSVELIREHYPEIKMVELDKNYGCPGGRNRGIEYCKGDYIFYLDNDGVLHKKAVELAVESIQKKERIKIVTGKVIHFDNEGEIDTAIPLDDIQKETKVKSFQGGVSLHDKSIYDEIGYYPDDYMYGGEEGNLALRLLAHGYEIVQNEAVVLWHVKIDVGRSKEERIQGFLNRFTTVYQFYPLFLVILFGLKYITQYTFLSFKYNAPFLFFKRSFLELPTRLKSVQRNPFTYDEIKPYHELPNLVRP